MTIVEFTRSFRHRSRVRYYLNCARRGVAFGVSFLVGLVFVVFGIVGFLPVVGFWMIPFGFGLIWLDLEPFVRGITRRLKYGDAPSNKSNGKKNG